jgi:vacuolar-type H+-ATPase subunit H
MEKRADQIKEDNILELLKKKEDEFEKKLAAAEEKARTCIKNAREKARLLETGLEDELKALKEQMVKEENIRNENIIKSIVEKNRLAIDKVKKQFLQNKEAAIKFIIEAVIPRTTGTRSKANDKKNE